MYDRQQQMQQLDQTLARLNRRLTAFAPVMECMQGLQALGVSGHVPSLAMYFLQFYTMLRDRRKWIQPATQHRADLDHLLPGMAVASRTFSCGLCRVPSPMSVQVPDFSCMDKKLADSRVQQCNKSLVTPQCCYPCADSSAYLQASLMSWWKMLMLTSRKPMS